MGIIINGQNDTIGPVDNSMSLLGTVSIGGTMTIEDFTNIDSVGVVTARSGLHVTGGSLGVGTNNPDRALSVSDQTNGNLARFIGPTNNLFIMNDRSGIIDLNSSGTGDHLCLGTQNVERLRITSGGLMGLGTQSPSSLLTLRQTAADHRIIEISRPNSDVGCLYLGNDSSSNALIASNNAELIFGKDFSGTFSEFARIDNNGFVGLGTDNPYHELHIQGSSDTRALITSGGTGDAVMMFENASGNTWGHGIDLTNNNYVIAYNSTSDPSLTADGKVEITTSGRLGVGIESPNSNLHIKGGSDSTDNLLLTLQSNGVASDGSLSTGLRLINSTANNSIHGADIRAIRTGSSSADLTFSLYDGAQTPTEKLRITSTGYVGIGEGAPGGRLTVKHANTATSGLNATLKLKQGVATNGNRSSLIFSSLDDYDVAAVNGVVEVHSGTSANNVGRLEFWTKASGSNAAERLRITSDGNMGLGVTPVYSGLFGGSQRVLHIGGTTAPGLRIQSSTSNQGDFIIQAGNSGGATYLSNLSNNADTVFYTTSGGSTGERLRINATGPISGNPNSGDGDDFAGMALKRDYNAWVDIFYQGWISGNSGWGTFWAGSSGAAYRRVSNDGNPNEYVFIGAGSKRFTFDLDYGGHAYFDGSLNQNNYDYAEYFEWEDGNPNNEDRRGYSVFLNANGKIERATSETSTSDIIGVISGTAAVIGDAAVYDWQGRYEIDEWGTRRKEQVTQVSWIDIDGTKHSYADENDVPSGIVVPDDASRRIHHRYIESSTYDSSQAYVPRDQRREWGIVGLLGKVRVRNDSPKHPNWKYIKTIAGKDLWLIK